MWLFSIWKKNAYSGRRVRQGKLQRYKERPFILGSGLQFLTDNQKALDKTKLPSETVCFPKHTSSRNKQTVCKLLLWSKNDREPTISNTQLLFLNLDDTLQNPSSSFLCHRKSFHFAYTVFRLIEFREPPWE